MDQDFDPQQLSSQPQDLQPPPDPQADLLAQAGTDGPKVKFSSEPQPKLAQASVNDTPGEDKPKLAPGQIMEQTLRGRSYNDDEIQNWKGQMSDVLKQRNFSPQEIKDFWGIKEPNMVPIDSIVQNNFAQSRDKLPPSAHDPSQPVEAKDIWEAFKAGFQHTAIVEGVRGKLPDYALGKDAGSLENLAQAAGQTVGDFPLYVGGMAAGGGPETPAGWAAAGFLPASAREWVTQSIQKGEIQDSHDLAMRLVSSAWEGAKSAAVNMVTMGVGQNLKVANALGGSQITKALTGLPARLAAESTAMETVASALEGHLPTLNGYRNSAVTIGGLHAAGMVVGGEAHGYVKDKLMNIWAKTGAPPEQVVQAVEQDPKLKTELLASNPDLPIEAAPPQAQDQSEPTDKATPPATGETPPPSGDVQDAKAHLLAKVVDVQRDDLGLVGKAKKLAQKQVADFNQSYRNNLDSTVAIKDSINAIKDQPIDQDNSHVLMRLHNAVATKVREWMQFGTEDEPFGKKNGEGFEPLMKEYKATTGDNDLSNFTAFGIGKRAMELSERGIDQGIDQEKAKAFVDAHPEIQPYFDRYVAFKNRVADYYQRSGMISKDEADAWKDLNKSYFSFSKHIEPDPVTGARPSGGARTIQKIGDSDLQINDPILQTYKDTNKMIRLAHENIAAKAYILNMEDSGRIRLSDEQSGMVGKNQVATYVEGKRTLWDAPPGDAEAVKAMAGNKPAMAMWGKWLRPYASLERALTIGANPFFAAGHAIRQQFTAGQLSKTGYVPFVTWLQYAPSYLYGKATHAEAYRQFVSDGGSVDSIMPMESWIDGRIKGLDKELPFLNRAYNQLKTVGEFSHFAIALHDNVIRFAEQQRLLDQSKDRAAAAFGAREVLPDFEKAGLQHSALLAVTPFLRVHLLGEARMFQALGEQKDEIMDAIANPEEKSMSERAQQVLTGYVAKGLAMMTVPSLLIAAAHKGDDAYDDLPKFLKWGYWNWHTSEWRNANSDAEFNSVKSAYPSNTRVLDDGTRQVDDGKIFRIQKPFTNGMVFGSAVDAAQEAFHKGKPQIFADFVKEVGSSMMADMIPPLPKLGIESMSNFNFYTAQPIIRQSMQNKLPELRYDSYTSDLAKKVASTLQSVPYLGENEKAASPVMVEHWIHSLGTGTYFVEGLLDKALKAQGEGPQVAKSWTEGPGARQFFDRYPNLRAQSVEDFEDRYRKMAEYTNSYKDLLKRKDIAGAAQLEGKYNLHADALKGYANQIRGDETNLAMLTKVKDSMSPEERRQLSDMMVFRIISVAKLGNKLMDQLDEAAKAKKAGN